MEGRQERLAERTDTPGLARVLTLVRERVAAPDRPHVDGFTRELLGKAPAGLVESDPARVAAMTASALAFLHQRGTSPMAVRVFAPQPQPDGWSSPLTVVESVVDDR